MGDPSVDRTRALHAKLAALRERDRSVCFPAPPGIATNQYASQLMM